MKIVNKNLSGISKVLGRKGTKRVKGKKKNIGNLIKIRIKIMEKNENCENNRSG